MDEDAVVMAAYTASWGRGCKYFLTRTTLNGFKVSEDEENGLQVSLTNKNGADRNEAKIIGKRELKEKVKDMGSGGSSCFSSVDLRLGYPYPPPLWIDRHL